MLPLTSPLVIYFLGRRLRDALRLVESLEQVVERLICFLLPFLKGIRHI